MKNIEEHIDLTIRSFAHQVIDLNKIKEEKLLSILYEYRKVAHVILNKQLTSLFKTGKLCIQAKEFYGDIPTFLSERYKDVIKRQVDGMLKSYISNLKNEFKMKVYKSKLSEITKKELYKINKSNLWFNKENFLARKIYKSCLKRNNFPNTKHINLILNTKVYKLEENKNTKSCSYIIKLFTCGERGEHIIIPLKSHTRFDNFILNNNKQNLIINNSIQINFDRKNKLKGITLSCSYEKYNNKNTKNKYMPKIEKIGLDFGLCTLFTTDKGDLFSQNFIKKLTYFDNKINNLVKELRKHNKNCKLYENKRYKAITNDLRAYIKNEVCRVLNRIVKLYNPKVIVVEELEFREQNLGKRLNRIINNCGISIIKYKLQSLSDEYGIEIKYINPCYTSQTCNSCGFVDKKNRLNREEFKCLCCGSKGKADIVAARNIVGRSNDMWFTKNSYATKEKIKRYLLDLHESKKIISGHGLSYVHVEKE